MGHCVRTLVRQALASNDSIYADSDVHTAGMVLEAIVRDRVILCVQPIFNTLEARQVLYHECLVRMTVDDECTFEYPSRFIPVLERLELMRFLDRYVVGMVIEALESNSNLCLGVNISAQSVNETQWWSSVLQLLEGKPDIARRLIVEVTETTQLSAESGRKFVEHLQSIGCRVAVDDFGDGFSIENGAHIPSPDIIKIAGQMLPGSGQSGASVDEFESLLARARASSLCVVVEGVEGAEALLAARCAGVDWAQGYHAGQPQRLGKTDSRDGNSFEHAMRQFDRIADALIDGPVDSSTRNNVRLAFASGLVQSMYGRHSAVAKSLRTCLTDVVGSKACQRQGSAPLLRCFSMLGRLSGRNCGARLGHA